MSHESTERIIVHSPEPLSVSRLLDSPRQYLGMSSIGMCPAKEIFRLRWARKMPGYVEPAPLPATQVLKMQRGSYLEPLVIKYLEACGFTFTHTGENQDELAIDLDNGQMKGHPDGYITGAPAGYEWAVGGLLEVKTAAPYPFSKLESEGVAPYYRDQTYCYQSASGKRFSVFAYFEPGAGTVAVLGPIVHNPVRMVVLKERAESIIAAVNSGEPPELSHCQPTAAWECESKGGRCQWYDVCPKMKAKADAAKG